MLFWTFLSIPLTLADNVVAYKYAFFDIDGTIKPPGEPFIPERNADGLTGMSNAGMGVFVSTGRSYSQVQDIFAMMPDSFLSGYVTENGAYVLDQSGNVVFSALTGTFASARASLMIHLEQDFAECLADSTCFFQDNSVNLTIKPAEGTSKEDSMAMVVLFEESVTTFLQDNVVYADVMTSIAHWDALDVVPTGVSKDLGIQRLAEFEQMDLTQAIFAGDAQNDPFVLLDQLGIDVCTHGAATDYAIEAVTELGGKIFWDCDDTDMAMCMYKEFVPGNGSSDNLLWWHYAVICIGSAGLVGTGFCVWKRKKGSGNGQKPLLDAYVPVSGDSLI
jgi:HAD superfamily hydrolase (TIGR01484 family)